MIKRTISWAGIILLLLLYSLCALAQPLKPSSLSQQTILEEVRQYARRHARNGSPIETRLVLDLYKDNAAGLAPQQIAQTYEEEFVKAKAAASREDPWVLLRPKAGWVAAAVLGILLIFHDLLKSWFSAAFKLVGDAVYQRLAGHRLLRLVALRRYRKALIEKYRQIRIPFRPNRPLNLKDVYVPLLLASDSGIGEGSRIDAYRALAHYRRLMIKGPPGSGKSMLLRHIALAYAEGRLQDLPDRPIPILLDLHRLNEDDSIDLERHLAIELGRNGFPHAESFVRRNLESGSLLLLLDGLDEVASDRRAAVATEIVDFLGKHRRCRFLSTCRTAIYREEFASMVEQTLEVDEFSDQQIRHFLGSWESSMPPGKSVDQLIYTLSDRPRIIALARNPLLLTIIAYLYSDTTFQLPHSRSEFYESSTDVLLNQWHHEHNRFKPRDKRLVLQHLALLFQDGIGGHDRRSGHVAAVIASIRSVLPDLGLSPDIAGLILDEIVERSGLLLSIDGGERYAFAHLTLQEFFAAEALRDNADAMLMRFRKDHDAWREAIRLWCGLYPDGTTVVREVHKEEPITAFECLAEVQKVDQDLAGAIVEEFKALIGREENQTLIIEAFGSVASDNRSRGAETFAFLVELLDDNDSARRAAAGAALARTNIPRAAEVLASHRRDPAELRSTLVRMGDLAVPALFAQVDGPASSDALDDLFAIGTPSAATRLALLLWHAEPGIRERAAWRLSSLLEKPGVEDALRSIQLREDMKASPEWLWVWEPFREQSGSSLPAVASRIAFLLSQSKPPVDARVDRRLAIPLCLNHPGAFKFPSFSTESIRRPAVRDLYVLVRQLRPDWVEKPDQVVKLLETLQGEELERLVRTIVYASVLDERWACLLCSVDANQAAVFLKALLREPRPLRSDWVDIFNPIEYEFRRGWHFRLVFFMFVCISVIAFLEIYQILSEGLDLRSLTFWLGVVGGVELIGLWFVLWRFARGSFSFGHDDIEVVLMIAVAAIFAPFLFFSDSFRKNENNRREWGFFLAVAFLGPIFSAVFWTPFAAVGYFASFAIVARVPVWVTVAFWVLTLGGGALLWLAGRKLHRAAQNPLRGLLDKEGIQRPIPSIGRRRILSILRLRFL